MTTDAPIMPSFTDPEELRGHQLDGLKWTVAHAYNGSSEYRQKFDAAGVVPADIQQLDDLRRLPFTTAEDLRKGYPFPLRCVPFEKIIRIHSSSGTTGKRKNLCYTRKDVDDWAHFFARCFQMAGVTAHDRVQIAVGYGVWTAGVGFQAACEKMGAMALPAGPGKCGPAMSIHAGSTVHRVVLHRLHGAFVGRRNQTARS